MEDNKVNGKPTKRFFISMLTRDITVNDAIGDLVDNAVDAARKAIYEAGNPKNIDLFTAKYENTFVTISIKDDKFVISDNAGGIPFDIAQKYAFAFGRPEDFDGTPGSIGQFGIGMKRAFFKLGKKITVESSTLTDYFKVEIDVDEWQSQDDWDFDLTDKRHETNPAIGYGTVITVENLHDDTIELFKSNFFIQKLKEEIGLENWYNISKGMKISINDLILRAKELIIKEDELLGLKAGRWQHKYGDVDVRIICGIGERGKKEDGGWYIFCNDRLILANEQTSLTGWGGEGRMVKGSPEYHGQYQLFRGFVFFESQNPSSFPWNTAKTSINPENPLYIKVKEKMISMMREVISYLNKIKKEKDGQGRRKSGPSPTELKIDNAQSLSIKDVALKTLPAAKFAAPETEKKIKQTNGQTIKYEVETDKFEIVSDHLGITDPSKIGLITFNYYLENET